VSELDFFGGEDGTCEACRRGETAYCQNAIMTGITTDGGYAETMIAEARALALIPDALKSEDAAPVVCADITTFNALRNGARAGDTVAIQGVAGLATLACSLHEKWACAPWRLAGVPTKSTWRRN
jgi:propanol-preferring alcohol dehydrogenase